MKLNNLFKAVLVSMVMMLGLTACEKPGPAETAGKKLDQAAESVSKSIDNTVNDIDRSVKK